MLHGIVVDVIYTSLKIAVVANGVLPKSALPEIALPARIARQFLSRLTGASCKCRFDPAPSSGKVSVIWWQRPDGVEMLRKNDDGVEMKWMRRPYRSESIAQYVNMLDEHR